MQRVELLGCDAIGVDGAQSGQGDDRTGVVDRQLDVWRLVVPVKDEAL